MVREDERNRTNAERLVDLEQLMANMKSTIDALKHRVTRLENYSNIPIEIPFSESEGWKWCNECQCLVSLEHKHNAT